MKRNDLQVVGRPDGRTPVPLEEVIGHTTTGAIAHDLKAELQISQVADASVGGPYDTEGAIEFRRQKSLIKTDALQDAIFNSAYFSCIATDEQGVIQIFNVGAERMLGYSAADVVNRITPAELSDPQELIARAAALSAEFDTIIAPGFDALVFKASRGIEDIYELTKIRKDGIRFPAIVSVTALRDARDGIIGYLLIGTDNTARKQVEADRALLDQRLRDQQFYTRSLIESNIDALMTTDPQGIITDVNQQMIALTGLTRDELIGSPCRNSFTDPVRADTAIKRVLAENKVSNYELTVRARNGTETVVSYNAATFHNRDRQLQGVFAAARDITERQRFERVMQEKSEIEHASQMKSEFLATMSHELRTPLNAIIGFSEAMKDDLIGPLTDVQKEYMGDIFASGQHLLSLINDILDLSKIEAGMMALDLESADLVGMLSRALSIVREQAAVQRVTLELDTVGADLGTPQLDLRKTKQIVYNLLSNAVKFSASGGRVVLGARRVGRDAVGKIDGDWPVFGFALAASAYEEFLEISVSDLGIGISVENMAKLFEAFSQIDTTLGRKFEGTGLGLAMVKQLAELHGGTVAVASKDGAGARFVVWLPMRDSRTALQEAALASFAGAETETRIALVIEEDERASDLVRVLLEYEGFEVLRACTAESALRVARQTVPSLITLDLDLPGGDGEAFLQMIRGDKSLASVPVVIFGGAGDSNVALASGAAAVLQKPISRAQLKASLAHLGLPKSDECTHTVLVVDDDPKAVEVIATFLPAPTYAVVRAYSGGEAVTLARRLVPDLILLDLLMPGMSGFEVVERLQLDPVTASIPIVVVTAKQVSAADRASLNDSASKVVCVIEKSGFNRARFVAEVRRALVPHSKGHSCRSS